MVSGNVCVCMYVGMYAGMHVCTPDYYFGSYDCLNTWKRKEQIRKCFIATIAARPLPVKI